MEEQYVSHLSDFTIWDQLKHASEWILFEENLSEYISIDETALSQGELYAVVTNKLSRGRKGSLIALIKGTESEKVGAILKKISSRRRDKVKEVTLDMSTAMQKIVNACFPGSSNISGEN